MDPATGMMIGSTLLGAGSGKASAKAANKPKSYSQTSQTKPYGGTSNLDMLLDQGMNLFSFGSEKGNIFPDIGPSFHMEDALNAIRNGALGGAGGGGGSGAGRAAAGGGGGRGRGGGGGGGGLKGFGDYLANYQVKPNQWMESVLQGDFLGSNPYLEDVISNLSREAGQAHEQYTLPGINQQFNSGGRYGSGAQARANILAGEQFDEGLMGEISGIRAGSYESERDRMMQALGLLSGENTSARSNLAGVKQSGIAANAQKYAANKALQGTMAQVGLGRANLQQSKLMDYLSAATGVNASATQNKLLPYTLYQEGVGTLLPIMQNFGQSNTYGRGSGAGVSPGASAVSGGLSGLFSGAAMGNLFGGNQGQPSVEQIMNVMGQGVGIG